MLNQDRYHVLREAEKNFEEKYNAFEHKVFKALMISESTSFTSGGTSRNLSCESEAKFEQEFKLKNHLKENRFKEYSDEYQKIELLKQQLNLKPTNTQIGGKQISFKLPLGERDFVEVPLYLTPENSPKGEGTSDSDTDSLIFSPRMPGTPRTELEIYNDQLYNLNNKQTEIAEKVKKARKRRCILC